MYYYLDDNLMALVENGEYKDDEDLSLNSVRFKLRRFEGVIVSTPELAKYFLAKMLHEKVDVFPVSYASAPKNYRVAKHKNEREITIASLGGKHRHRGLRDHVLPALRQLADDGHRVHVVVGGCFPQDCDFFKEVDISDENFRITLVPFDVDWNRAMLQIAEYQPDIVIHAPSKTINNKYKTLNIALCAYVLDSLLVVPNGPPYDTPAFKGSAIVVECSSEPRAWFQTLTEIFSTPEAWVNYKKANTMFCRRHFSGEQNVAVLNRILENAPAISPTTVESRLKEMYFSKPSVSAGSALNTESLKASLLELSLLRSRIRMYRRFKPRFAREDLWSRISPAFEDIRRYVQINRARPPASYLELSDAIQDKAFVEYPVELKQGKIRNISCAFSSDGIHEGVVGVELVNPSGEITKQATISLEATNLHFPVTFDLAETGVPMEGIWRLRFFARSSWPIYILEFAKYSHLGWTRQAVAPFAKVEYATQV
ncbi:MAG: glycosyltransferase [Mesorhizobium sp.]|nr:MAG: glycosyltransferase [Mesorhizobium sp.]